MPSLAPALRRKLEDAVKEARDVAEAGSRAALEQLAVHAAEPFGHLSPDDRELRNRLRARARQLGDVRDARTGAHQIDHLVVECAYEHWHRMLFARFLAENGVLMANSETLGIENTPVTLEECEELAADEGAANGWELAGRYASRMLPQIFRPDAPVLAMQLPPERQRRLEQILADLAPETFKASDALGWVYQFWQAKKKDDVNASGVKIGADELPAVTQLFTEPYMVEFILHNTLGAWWAGKVLAERPGLARSAADEEQLREACALPGCAWEYLRFSKSEELWQPAAGTHERWPREAAQLKVLDPSCGSGHFLVEAFKILVRIRSHEEGIPTSVAADAVLRDNLHGLELDERCTQIAVFALAMTAWTLPSARGYRALPIIHVACSGLAPRAKRHEWAAAAGGDRRIEDGVHRLYDMFAEAPVLGSLIDPTTAGSEAPLLDASFAELTPFFEKAVEIERREGSYDGYEAAIAACEINTAARLLASRFHLVVTNVPYLGREKQSPPLKRLAEKRYASAKHDLATVFVLRTLELLEEGCTTALVLPQYWLFLSRYKALRRHLLTTVSWDSLATLGPGAFDTISGEVVNTCLAILTTAPPGPTRQIAWADVSAVEGVTQKAAMLRSGGVASIVQSGQLRNPDAIIGYVRDTTLPLLNKYAYCYQGLATSDNAQFVFNFWEVLPNHPGWHLFHFAPSRTELVSGNSHVIFFEDGQGRYHRHAMALKRVGRLGGWKSGHEAWGQRGIAINRMGDLPCSLYLGEKFDCNVAVLVPNDPDDLPTMWAFCSSPQYAAEVRRINKKLSVTNATLAKVPFNVEEWRKVASEKFPDGLPESPTSTDPTQWNFDGSLPSAQDPLQVGVAHLLGYHWFGSRPVELSDIVDDDGIVCVPSVRGEAPAVDRLLEVLTRCHGSAWSTFTRDKLLAGAGADAKGLRWWLENAFFEQHCQLFQHRPFIWHIWDGIKKDGFGALVNYHKLDRKLLETLTYTYLGDWIRRQQDDAARNVDGASERLDAARRLQQSLELVLEGEKPYDIFVRWKPLHEQPVGWEPDLNDGVRLNIRPFMLVPDVDRKGAGVLRYKPNVHWRKDRGIDPDEAPWFRLGPEYGEKNGARINDHHLSLSEKRAARDARGGRT